MLHRCGPCLCVLELLRRERDQLIDLPGCFVTARRVVFADFPVAFARVGQSIERDADADEAPMRFCVPPLGFDPRPRFVDRIHRLRG